MYKRDVAVVLLACVAMLVSIQHEGTFSFRKAWYHNPYDATQDVLVEHHELPQPLVADLNGDGHFELVMATPDLKIQVVQPQAAGRQGEGFAVANIITEVSLMYKRVAIPSSRRPVAMAVGYLDPLPKEIVRAPRKQVIVIVTASWQVLCLDHNLKLLWEQDIQEEFPHNSHIKEVSIFVSPHQVRVGDRGLVVVGASVERGDLAAAEGEEGGREELDVLKQEMVMEQETRSHAKSAKGKAGKLEELDAADPDPGVDTSRHFNYFAFEGGKGEQRWHHTSTDFHKDLGDMAEELQPQNDYRLDAEKLEGRHFGEASCRDYRESVLAALPHVWSMAQDTHMEEAHFVKHKAGRGAQRQGLGAKKGAKGPTAKSGTVPPKPQQSKGVLGGLKAPRHVAADAGSGSRSGRHHHNHHHHHHGNVTVNALVTYLEEGIEVIHLFTGRTICKLHLAPGVLHADINGDGMVDHVSVFHGVATEEEEEGHAEAVDVAGHSAPHHCKAVASSGIPPRETLYSINICGANQRYMSTLTKNIFARLMGPGVEMATPIMLPVPELSRSAYRSRLRQHGLVVFLTSRGEATAVNAKGEYLWQRLFPVAWPAGQDEDEADTAAGGAQVVPTLQPLALRVHAVPTAILMAGQSKAVVVSEHGNVLETLALPYPPTQPLVVADFNGDGLADIVLVTKHGLYGYVQVAHMGGMALSALLLTLIIAMGIVYYTQVYDAGGKKPHKLRSTEYVD